MTHVTHEPWHPSPQALIDDDGIYHYECVCDADDASLTNCTSAGVDPYSTGVHVGCCSGSTEARR